MNMIPTRMEEDKMPLELILGVPTWACEHKKRTCAASSVHIELKVD